MLSKPFLKNLATKAQHLRPVIVIGNKGLTDAVHQEIESALLAHELIKIKVNAQERADRTMMINTICERHEAALVQAVGHVVVVYKANIP
jgi:RNA-binding protein